MAYITVVSGGAQPVFATDVLNGTPAQSSNVANAAVTNFQGPKLDLFTVVANAALTAQGGIASGSNFVSNVLQAIQQTSTVAMYQVGGAQNANIAMALYPTGAYDTANLVAAAQTANTATIGIPTANVFARATFVTQGTYYS